MQAQSTIAYAFAGLRGGAGSPEMLAWILILLRAFHCLEAVRSSLHRNSDFTGNILLRVAAEIEVHQLQIRYPWSRLLRIHGRDAPEEKQSAAWRAVRDRLRAYTAWCLAKDREFFEQRRDWREVNKLFAPTLPAEAQADEREAALLAFVFGPPQVISEQEALEDRRKAIEAYDEAIGRIDHWLSDERLSPWHERLGVLTRSVGWVPSNFGQMFNDRETSFAKALQQLGLRHEYGVYAQASSLIHGGSVESFIRLVASSVDGRSIVYPRCLPDREMAEELCTDVAYRLHGVATYLWAMRDHVLYEETEEATA